MRVHHHANRVAVLGPFSPECVEDQLAIISIRAAACTAITLRIDDDLLAIGECDAWPRNVRVCKQAVGSIGCAERLRKIGQRLFCLSAQCVWCISQAVVELKGERRQSLIFTDVRFDDLPADLDDLRLDPRSHFAESREHNLRELRAFLRFRISQIFITIQRRVDRDATGFLQGVGNEPVRCVQ